MKRITTIILATIFMVLGVATAFQDFTMPGNQTAMAQAPPLQWNVMGKMPLDLQLDLDKRLSHESCTVDTISITDTVYVDKIKWKTRYKTVANRTLAREEGIHPAAVTPDSMLLGPPQISTPVREEQPGDVVGTSKVPSILLTVDGQIVYNSEDEIHSAEEGQ